MENLYNDGILMAVIINSVFGLVEMFNSKGNLLVLKLEISRSVKEVNGSFYPMG